MNNKMNLYSAWYCPFAQRAWMALFHKGIDFNYIETDPYNKTAEWMKISKGSGQVPVLEHFAVDGTKRTLVDSLKIVEFINDNYQNTGPKFFPDDPLQRTESRFWNDYVNTEIIPYFYRFLKADKLGKARNTAREKMLEGLDKFTRAMSADGPFFNGSELSAVDIDFAPFAYRIKLLLEHYRNFSLPENDDYWLRYEQWYKAVIAEPAFIKSSFEQGNYQNRLIEFYYPYSLGGGQADVTDIKAA